MRADRLPNATLIVCQLDLSSTPALVQSQPRTRRLGSENARPVTSSPRSFPKQGEKWSAITADRFPSPTPFDASNILVKPAFLRPR